MSRFSMREVALQSGGGETIRFSQRLALLEEPPHSDVNVYRVMTSANTQNQQVRLTQTRAVRQRSESEDAL